MANNRVGGGREGPGKREGGRWEERGEPHKWHGPSLALAVCLTPNLPSPAASLRLSDWPYNYACPGKFFILSFWGGFIGVCVTLGLTWT